MKIKGFDKLQKQLKDAQRALSELDGELGVVKFNPHDPSSIESAINQISQTIDLRVREYVNRPAHPAKPMGESGIADFGKLAHASDGAC